MTKLVCPDCQHENEVERIYCHNCGSRLDRSAVKKEITATEESTEVTQRRLQHMFSPTRGRTKRMVAQAIKLILGACCLAALIQMLLPPDLPEQSKSDSLTPMISMDLLSALQAHNPPRLTYSGEQVNAYLAAAIKRKNSPAKESFFPIQRLSVQFNEGTCSINMTRSFLGLPISEGATYGVATGEGTIAAAYTSGYVGRMPIHPQLMRACGPIFQKAWETLDRERQQIAKLAGLEFHSDSVTLLIVR